MSIKEKIFDILRIIFTTLWRLALTVAAAAAICVLGASMVLSLVFNGPSVTARDQLTMTLMESETTRSIPVYYLGQAAVNRICNVEDTLPAAVSDPARITISGQDIPLTGSVTIENRTFSATVRLFQDSSQVSFGQDGDNFAGFTAEGILVVSTSADKAAALGLEGTCGRILIMNGQINEGLMGALSGWAPRCAIGQRADGTLILVSTNGWEQNRPGATYQDLINILTEQGAVNACCLTTEE